MYQVRPASHKDIDSAMNCVRLSRLFMAENGNPYQWDDSYPSAQLLEQDVDRKVGYVICENDTVIAYFAFIKGADPTYQVIDGSWSSSSDYGTVHRLASDCTHKGIARACFDYCATMVSYIRCDTHECNKAMRRAMENYGFKQCGTIYLENGDPRIAYDFTC